MTILPRTLAGRTTLALLAGLVISNLVGLLIFSGERDTALSSAAGANAAERIAAVIRVMERTPPADRAAVVCAQSGRGFAVTVTRVAVVQADAGGRVLQSAIRGLLGNPMPERLRVAKGQADTPAFDDTLVRCMAPKLGSMPGMMRGMTMTPRMARMMRTRYGGDTLLVSYRLEGGTWLNVMTLAQEAAPFWRSRFLVAFFVMAVIVTLLSAWAVRRSTAPLALFARAAERLGRDMNAPNLPENGPREVHRAARAFNEMQRRLRRLIGDRTQMLAAISHDLRTPITRLRLRAEFVGDAELRGKMLVDLEQMEAMIASTLAFAREDGAQEPRRTLDLALLVQGVCDDAADIGSDVVYAGPDRASYSGRPLALRRVFANLVDNAVKYGDRARVALDAAPDGFVVTVEDDGAGIPEDEFERVFEPFHRIEASRNRETGGAGLGLAVVRSIVRAHGGDVTLANRAEGGLRATVKLPHL